MTTTIGIDEAQVKLKDIIARLGPGDEVVITDHDMPVARIVAANHREPVFGSCRGMLAVIEEDDEHLEDFKEYMP